MKPDDKLPDEIIRNYSVDAVIAQEEQRCICGSYVSFRDCVKCKAKGMSPKASLILITTNDDVVTNVKEVWVH